MAELFGKKWSRDDLRRRVGDMSQVAGIRLAELSDGRERGVRIAEFDTGSGFRFTVLIDRAMDIGPASLNGRSITWQSGTGATHPAYYQPEGTEWLRTFSGGLLCLCGLSSAGAPTKEDAWGGHGLHGRISNTPAYGISSSARWIEDEYEMWMEGSARETSVYGVDLVLTRHISAWAGQNKVSVRDTIENAGFAPAPLMLLYHCNFGFPLVDEHSHVVVNDIGMRPRDAVSSAGAAHALEIDPPITDYQEQVFFHDVRPDADGFTQASIVNDRIDKGSGLAACVRFRKAELPYLVHWKQMGAGAYVVGLEPSNGMVSGRLREQEAGRLRILQPGETVQLALDFGAAQGKEAITTLLTTGLEDKHK
jgi:hypothetical protein